MEGQHIKGLMEAYSTIYSEPELLDEEVDMELEEDFEVLDEQGNRNRPSQETINRNRTGLANTLLYGNPEGRKNRVTTPRQRNRRGGGSSSSSRPVANLPADYKQTELAAGAAAEKSRPGAGLPVSGGGNQGSNRPTTSRPSTAPASKPAPAKPVVKQTGDKAKDMATWAKANPKLAAAKAEKDRIRGTAQTDNPLMKDFRKKMPAGAPTVQSPAVAKLGAGNQSLVNNPNAGKAATPAAKPAPSASATPAAKPAPAAAKPAPVAPKPQLSARAQALKAGGPKGGARERMLNQDVDMFDLVKGHLLDEGYAETEQAALTIMANMSEEWRQDILEFLGGQKGDGYLGHPRLGIKNPLAKKQANTNTSKGGGPDVAGTGRNIGNIRSRQEDMIRKTLGR